MTRVALSLPHVELCGFHCHVGSQVFDSDVYLRAADVMLTFVADIYSKTGFLAKELDIKRDKIVLLAPIEVRHMIAMVILQLIPNIKVICEEEISTDYALEILAKI